MPPLDARRTYAYALTDLHPDTNAAQALFRGGHFTDAIRRAAQDYLDRVAGLVEPGELVRRDRAPDLDGTPLIEVAFDETTPVLGFERRPSSRATRDEHLGHRYLALGLSRGLRNVMTHDNQYPLDEPEAFECLAFISMMHRRLDRIDVVQER